MLIHPTLTRAERRLIYTDYFEIAITQTAKPAGKCNDKYSVWNEEHKKFKTLQEVKDFLKAKYGSCKRERIYRDREEGAAHIGYVYCYKDRFYDPESKLWFCQDWVEVDEVHHRVLIV